MMSEEEIIEGIRLPGRFDVEVESVEQAQRLVRKAIPEAVELPPGISGSQYPSPSAGTEAWHQQHPAEPSVGNNRPHVKYADWRRGKKGRGGSWGHVFFPPTPEVGG